MAETKSPNRNTSIGCTTAVKKCRGTGIVPSGCYVCSIRCIPDTCTTPDCKNPCIKPRSGKELNWDRCSKHLRKRCLGKYNSTSIGDTASIPCDVIIEDVSEIVCPKCRCNYPKCSAQINIALGDGTRCGYHGNPSCSFDGCDGYADLIAGQSTCLIHSIPMCIFPGCLFRGTYLDRKRCNMHQHVTQSIKN